jgi:hypothetical protein
LDSISVFAAGLRFVGFVCDVDGGGALVPGRLAEAITANIFVLRFLNQRLAAASTTGEKKWASK